MATLKDLIYTPRAVATHDVRINGVRLLPKDPTLASGVPAFLGIEYNDAAARIYVNNAPSWMRGGQDVVVKLGYNGLNEQVWRGFISAMPGEDVEYLRTKVVVRGTEIEIGVPPDTSTTTQEATATLVGADVRPPLPVIDGEQIHIEHEVTNDFVHDADRLSWLATAYLERYGVVPRQPSGEMNRQVITCHGEIYKADRPIQLNAMSLALMTDEDAMRLICERVGIERVRFIEPEPGWFQLDTDAETERGRPIDALVKLAEIGQLQLVHTRDGVLTFRPVRFAPAPTHAWSYSTEDQDLARIIGTPGQLEVMWNPYVEKFSTGLIDIPFLNFNSERVFARDVSHVFTSERQVTIIDAWGGDRLGGTIGADPVASYDFRVTRKVHGDAVYLEFQCDASGSFDPESTAALTYAWTCNRTTIPAALPATKKMAFRVAATVAQPLQLTLTVTSGSGSGRTDTLVLDLPISSTDPKMEIPAVFASLDNTVTASPDGGSNWNDVAGSTSAGIPGALIADGVHAGECCYPFNSGVIKLTTDFGVSVSTVLNDAAHGNILVIEPDRLVLDRLWAGTSNGRLLVSRDRGATWALYKNFGDGYALRWIATPDSGGVWVGGGDATVASSLIRFDPVVDSGNWQSVAIAGHLSADLVGAGSSVYCRAAATTMAGELAIILNGTVPGGVNVFYTTSVLGDGSGWTRATGLTAGLTDGRGIIPGFDQGTFRAFFADRDAWETTNGVAYSERNNILDVGESANHVLWLGQYTGFDAALIAAQGAIYEWPIGETAAAKLRPATGFATWPASAVGRGLAIGAPGVSAAANLPRIAIVHDVGGATTWDISYPAIAGISSWTSVALPANVTSERPRPICLTRDLWFVENVGGFPTPTNQSFGSECNREMARTRDGGATWESISIGDETCTTERAASGDEINHLSRIVRDAGGRLWAARQLGTTTAHPLRTEIRYSDDDGDTWTLSSTLSVASAARPPYALLAHPSNPDIVVLISAVRTGDEGVVIHYTADRGSTWTTNTPTVASGNNFAHTQNGNAARHLLLRTGRLVIVNRQETTLQFKIYTSDNYGLTWTLRYTETEADEDCMALFAQGQWKNLGAQLVGIRAPVDSGDTSAWSVIESDDGGITWTTRDVDTPPGATRGDHDAVYDGASDSIFVQNGTIGTAANRLYRLKDATTGGTTWEDVTGDLPYLNTNMHWEGIALIPAN